MSNSEQVALHQHGEAFRLMKYRCDSGCHNEIIWNSRDGVTPFIIRSRDGAHKMTHIEWRTDVYAPDHKPKTGERIFVTMTPELAAPRAEKYVDEIYKREKRYGYWDSREEAVAYFVQSWVEDHGGGAPCIVEVTE